MPSVASRMSTGNSKRSNFSARAKRQASTMATRRADERGDLHEAGEAVDDEGAVPGRRRLVLASDRASAASASTTIASALTSRAERSPAKTPTISSAMRADGEDELRQDRGEAREVRRRSSAAIAAHGVEQSGRRPAGERRLVVVR